MSASSCLRVSVSPCLRALALFSIQSQSQTAPPPTAPEDKTATPETGTKPAPGGVPDATPRGAGTPDSAAKPPAEGDKPDEDDKDPYEGIAPEELPPDLQYDADSSVSFPTNI